MTQAVLDLGHRPALGREDFLVGACNQAAVERLDRWPEWRALALHGPAGAGKTHLAQVWAARAGARLLSGDGLADAPGTGEAAGCWVVEDADRGVDERSLLHLYNALAEGRGSLLLTARLPPARWPVTLPDLRSRLAAMATVALGPPDDALLEALLVKLFSDRQLRVRPDVITYLAARVERTFEAARRTVAAIDAAALAGRRNVTVALARAVLGDASGNEV